MKQQVTAIIAVVLLLFSGNACASENFSSTLFSIKIPAGMLADDQKADSISLIFAGDNELEKGTLSVTAKKGKVKSLEDQWQKAKPTITNDRSILFEREEVTPALKWKVIGLKEKTGPIEMQSVTYYGVSDQVIYMLHYHCQEGCCSEIDGAFQKVLASFRTLKHSSTRH